MSLSPQATASIFEPVSPAKAKAVCLHCGSPLLDKRATDSGFCCNGCSYVHALVHEQGLDAYYDLKDPITSPADPGVFQIRDTTWIEEAQREAEAVAANARDAKKRLPELIVSVQGISCAGCVWLIERVFKKQPGARDIVVSPHQGTMKLRWFPGEFPAAGFARKLQSIGYLTGPAGAVAKNPESRGLAMRIGLCAAFALNVMLYVLPSYFGMEPTFEYARLFGLLSVVFGTLSFLVGGTYFLSRAVHALRERAMHIDLPIAIGIVGAFAGSIFGWLAGIERLVYFDFLSVFILLMLIGRWAQVAAVERNKRRLLNQQPAPRRIRLSSGAEVSPEQLREGEAFTIGSGQTVPVESRLDGGEALFSLASINGEPEPRLLRAGQLVPAGAVNAGHDAQPLTALQGWSESLLARLMEPGARGGGRQHMLENIVKGYLAGILAIAAVSGVWWWLASRDIVQTWSVVTAVLVVSCPCAIGLAFPLADEMATVGLRRRGVFVLDSDLWSRLGRVRALVFDKTGTLTLETPVLLNPEAVESLDDEARRALYTLVRDNPHPVSQSLLEHLLAIDPTVSASTPPVRLRETIGQGVESGEWSLGRAGWRTRTPETCHLIGDKCPGETGTVLARCGVVVAGFRFADAVRPGARNEIAALRLRGLRVHILSGDETTKVTALATELGVPELDAVGGMSPDGKARWIDAHARDAMMLGDGANDSLAFERALCRGTPVIHRGVLERKSDFYYLGRGIGGLRALFDTNAARHRTQVTILAFSVIYNLAAVGLAVAGLMNPLVAAVLMPVNSLLTLAIVALGMRRSLAG